MAVAPTTSDRNYLDMINGTTSTGKKYNAVFGDDNSDMSVTDFFDLMVAQLTNQDFMNPVDDTQYLAQMAQFSTMQEMMDLCQYSKQNYVMGMLGQTVSLTNYSIGGGKKTVTGKVEKIMLDDGDYKIYIDGTPYDYSKVNEISLSTSSSSDNTNKPINGVDNGTGSSNDTTDNKDESQPESKEEVTL